MLRERLTIGLKGMAMGMAEVVPGVSGGTIAFISGIYERLLQSITAFSPALLKRFKTGGWAAVWTDIQGAFMVNLLIGMALGIVVGVFSITWLIEHYPPVIWAFFFGLILASAWYIGRMVAPWNLREILSLLFGFGIALAVVMGSPAQGNEALWFVFVSGAIAISALLLPGISGSFVLLLMGMYTYVVPKVKSLLTEGDIEALTVVLVFGLGCLFGLATFSRVLKWLFVKFPQETLSLLTGFMLGSLYKLWPWRVVTAWATDPKGEFILDDEGMRKVLTDSPVLPEGYAEALGLDPYFWPAILAAIGGVALIFLMSRAERDLSL